MMLTITIITDNYCIYYNNNNNVDYSNKHISSIEYKSPGMHSFLSVVQSCSPYYDQS